MYQEIVSRPPAFLAKLSDPDEHPSGVVFAEAINDLLKRRQPRPSGLRGSLIPNCAGVYGLFDVNELVYVGGTSTLAQRIAVHKSEPRYGGDTPKRFTHAAYFVLSPHQVDLVERRLIRKLQPKYNGKTGRQVWTEVLIDELAEVLGIQPGTVRAVCSANGIRMKFDRTVELKETLYCLSGTENLNIFRQTAK